jgi:hypothetical protein
MSKRHPVRLSSTCPRQNQLPRKQIEHCNITTCLSNIRSLALLLLLITCHDVRHACQLQALGYCTMLQDYTNGQCTTKCLDSSKCSSPRPPCAFRALAEEADFEHYRGCTDVCGLYLDDIPSFKPVLFEVFRSIINIHGHLSVTNNKNIYSLDFLENVVSVRPGRVLDYVSSASHLVFSIMLSFLFQQEVSV